MGQYECGFHITLNFPGIQLAHFVIQVGDRDGDNIWVHTHDGVIFIDDDVMEVGNKMSMTDGLVVEVCGVSFRCVVFPRSDKARKTGLEKEKLRLGVIIIVAMTRSMEVLRMMMVSMLRTSKVLRVIKTRTKSKQPVMQRREMCNQRMTWTLTARKSPRSRKLEIELSVPHSCLAWTA